MRKLIHALLHSRARRDRRGTASVEYGLIIAMIVLVMLVALTEVAGLTRGMWGNVSDKVTTAR